MKESFASKTLPAVLTQAQQLGEYLRVARKRRKLTMASVAERVNISYQTMVRLEKGDPSVSMGAYLSVIWLFDCSKGVIHAVCPDADEVGKNLEYSRLPTRVGQKRLSDASNDF